MTNLALIEKLEAECEFRLPDSYRSFLVTNEGKWYDDTINFNNENGHFVERFLTIQDIMNNGNNNCLGIMDEGLIFIGECSMTIYTYICFFKEDFGAIYGADGPEVYRLVDDFSQVNLP